MNSKMAVPRQQAIRGSILHFLEDPGENGRAGAFEYFVDGLLIVEDGRIARVGSAQELLPGLATTTVPSNCSGKLILPGFIDAHVHFVQTDVIGAYGRRLLEWLEEYTYPAERAFADEAHAREVAEFFVPELLRNGTTTALVIGSVHRSSVDAIFTAGMDRGMRLIAGKAMMDRNCPDYLRDTAASSYADSLALIERWHGRGRMQYAITPRFAPTSTPEQLAGAGRLAREHPDVYVHTHVAENKEEVAWAERLFPERCSYLDIYDHYGLLRKRAVLAHGIWLDDRDLERLAATSAALVHCPTCNLFMGSGLLDLKRATTAGVQVALGTDIGGGTSFGLLRVLHDAYKVAQLRGDSLSPMRAFYLATLGAARALDLADRIGSFITGREADFVVLDMASTPLLARRTSAARNLAEQLFLLMTLGDDRAVFRTYLMGQLRHNRDGPDSGPRNRE
ncbi:MAG: guanine deaminase [Steroidobacteraceae bacterium]